MTVRTCARVWSPVLLLAFVATAAATPVDEERWEETLRLVRETFPDVPQMSTERLTTLLKEGEDVVLLDARSEEEFETSHLQGAARAENFRSARDVLKARGEKPIVVVYCSVGYRSSRLARQLRSRGIENVFNLEGSLFKWANEGRPVHRGLQQVRSVHPFDEDWGELLDEAVRSE
ncbi:MAG: rhodanese-like domain-containing protein [Pseudomonadales bacterium]|nr:rhodanese-like domain-containing protein [Pseudomonadales bacterium]